MSLPSFVKRKISKESNHQPKEKEVGVLPSLVIICTKKMSRYDQGEKRGNIPKCVIGKLVTKTHLSHMFLSRLVSSFHQEKLIRICSCSLMMVRQRDTLQNSYASN